MNFGWGENQYWFTLILKKHYEKSHLSWYYPNWSKYIILLWQKTVLIFAMRKKQISQWKKYYKSLVNQIVLIKFESIYKSLEDRLKRRRTNFTPTNTSTSHNQGLLFTTFFSENIFFVTKRKTKLWNN